MAGTDLGPEAATEERKLRAAERPGHRSELVQYLAGLVERFRKEPGDGMLSKMVHEDGPDGTMSPQRLVANAMLLLVAGHDSTVNLIAHCVLTVLRNPGSLDLLRDRPDLVPGAIEEVLRLQSSVQFFPSRTRPGRHRDRRDGHPEGLGDLPPVRRRATATRSGSPTRTSSTPSARTTSTSAGASGIHTCFGGPLARLEVNMAFETFLRRVENPRLVVDPPPYRPNQIFRGPRHLLIDFGGIRD